MVIINLLLYSILFLYIQPVFYIMSFLTGLQTWISLNFSDFCDLLVAVGTIALAVVTFITLIYNKKL